MVRRGQAKAVSLIAVAVAFLFVSALVQSGEAVLEVIADKDGAFKVVGADSPVIYAHPRQALKVRITARKSTEMLKDGTVHTFTAPALTDLGWDLRLKEGTRDYALVAPEETGEYVILCTLKCGPGHETMRMKLIVR